MVFEVGEAMIAGRVAGIDGGDRAGEVILCKPRTQVGEAMGAE